MQEVFLGQAWKWLVTSTAVSWPDLGYQAPHIFLGG